MLRPSIKLIRRIYETANSFQETQAMQSQLYYHCQCFQCLTTIGKDCLTIIPLINEDPRV
ncbi:hypothetical protein BofuT4_uP059510.1 [Botrytis cinerea T4]|uniref:Uncharacterized protein n=1 Tax=Botryotinia fuckeliana (strain T4) TaxID=999810 RepID=G2XV51_BOTF4|nr:hypothetical protein BofuT4_uP059510.1 [Botrytis cinerea T4]